MFRFFHIHKTDCIEYWSRVISTYAYVYFLGLILVLKGDCHDSFCCCFPQSLQENAGTEPKYWLWLFLPLDTV